MSLPISGVNVGEVRIDPADGFEYRKVYDTGMPSDWVRNVPENLEPHAQSLVTAGALPAAYKINEIRNEPATGVSFKWKYNGGANPEWVLQSEISIASNIAANAVDSTSIEDGSIGYADLAPGVLKIATVTVSHADIMAGAGYTKNVIPAPAAGYYISPESIDVNYVQGSGGPYKWYNNMMMMPDSLSSFVRLGTVLSAPVTLSSSSFGKHQFHGYKYGISGTMDIGLFPGEGVYWGTEHAPDPRYSPANEASGGSIKITIAYRVLPV